MYDSSKIVAPTQLTKETILEKVSESYIMKHYLGFDFIPNRAYKSPLRKESNPSFAIYYNGDGSLRFKDFNGAQGTCFDFVMNLFNVNFTTALKIINQDLDLKIGIIKHILTNEPKKLEYNEPKNIDRAKKSHLIQFKPQHFTESDLKYWQEYGISKKTLEKYQVFAANFVFLNKKLILRYTYNNPIYCYKFNSKNVKVYRPNSHDLKWLSNVNSQDLQGLDQLNYTRDMLFITKSLKDVMCLEELGYSAVAPQSENTRTQHDIIKELCTKFSKIIILFDNDVAGIKGALDLKDYIGVGKCIFTEDVNCKDLSDFISKHGKTEAVEFLNKNI